ncbi:VCBS repeat-containing protein [Fulvivirgaceae bacterium BMA10]|uniref:VCBS repeat-containing protein n=1 Tax=Splendidivirga corallicola TaxID=3051826 RepID=A0ABT8KPU6_9BACT|nr:VCBS repeat-containing protein [Fulvivirgaceae bacterium BMA10]
MRSVGLIALFFVSIDLFAQDQEALFTLLDPGYTQVTFANHIKDQGESDIFHEQNYYNGGGVAIGDINNDGLLDIFFTGNQVPDKLYLNLGDLKFKDITEASGIADDGNWSTGVTMADVNNDGLLDIYVSRDILGEFDRNHNKLWLNKGGNKFEEVAGKIGLDNGSGTVQATFFDYDKDNDLDVFMINHPPNPGYFGDRSIRHDLDSIYCSRLYRNDNGQFTDVSESAQVLTFGYLLNAVATDLNDDGWTDLYASSDFITPDFLYLNQKDGTFRNVALESFKHTSYSAMGSDVADMDNDGLLDIVTVDMAAEDNRRLKANMSGMDPEKFWKTVNAGYHYQYMFNTLQWNRGKDATGRLCFSEIGHLAGIATTDWSWGPLFADFDNDGFKDLFITNGYRMDYRNTDAVKKLTEYSVPRFKAFMENTPQGQGSFDVWSVLDFEEVLSLYPSEKLANYMYRNTNGLQFEKVNRPWGVDQKTFSNGAAYGDLDNDGDLDLVVNNINDPAFIYRNNTERYDQNYLKIVLTKNAKRLSFFGAKIRIDYQGEKGPESQTYELTNARGFQSSSIQDAHFGLGTTDKVNKLTVYWPDGSITEKRNVKANQLLIIDQKKVRKPASPGDLDPLFEEITSHLGIDYVHVENDFDDYKKEVLLPHKMSTLGPALEVGDINGDALEDIFIGGTAGQPGTFFIQEPNGGFTKVLFDSDRNLEDTGCALFDADGDRDLDLYVASGSNEFSTDYAYQDRLYLNDGLGNFTRSFTSLPWFSESTATIKPFDYDRDGDLDLFIGGRQVPGKYPSPANSYILRNEGLDGGDLPVFKDITAEIAPALKAIGMVTDALWTDYDRDGDIDLILVGEWMPLTILENEQGSFRNVTSKKELDETVGWWFSIEAADFDGDGDEDMVLGNLGLNYKYKASFEEPFEVYYDDFDHNGSRDIVLSYYNFGEKYPVRGRSCSAQQVPSLKQKFPNYNEFAIASLSDVYGVANLEQALHYQAKIFSSMYGENLGDGKFSFKPLPVEAQISSINDIIVHDFDHDGSLDMTIAGGLYDAEVETSRNDASVGLFLKGDGKGNFSVVKPRDSGLYLFSNIRDMALLNTGNTRAMVSLANNDRLIVYRFKQIQHHVRGN